MLPSSLPCSRAEEENSTKRQSSAERNGKDSEEIGDRKTMPSQNPARKTERLISRRWRLPSGRRRHVAVILMLPSVVIIPSSVLHQWMKQLPRASPISYAHRQTKHSLAQHDDEQFDKKQDDSIEETNEDEDAESQSINANPKEPQTME